MSTLKITECKARLIREEFWAQTSSPPQSEYNAALDAAQARVDPLYHSTLKFVKILIKIPGLPGKKTGTGSSFNLSDSWISGNEYKEGGSMAPVESTVSISLDSCCGTKENPPAGTNFVTVYLVKREKLPEIRTVAQAHESAKVTVEWLYSWKEPDIDYVYSVFKRTRSWYEGEMAVPDITPQRYVGLKAGLNKLIGLWRRKDYEGLCSYCHAPFKTLPLTEPVYSSTQPLMYFKKTLTTENTYKNHWKCKNAVANGYTGPCCDSSSSSSSGSPTIVQTNDISPLMIAILESK